MTPKTSDTDPLYVTWIDESLQGKVGLTFAPGKRGAGAWAGGVWHRDLKKDLDHLVAAHDVGLLVCLLEDHELRSLEIPTLVDEAARRMAVRRLPIPDGGVLPDMGPVRTVVQGIEKAARGGTNVVIHCRGGLGRAGTVGGCFLKHLGHTDDDVFAALRKRHATSCPETEAQRLFIRAFGPG
jgi:protein-tyrosine phosphatase